MAATTNSIHLSAEFMRQAFKAFGPKFVLDLPTGIHAHISLRNLRVKNDQIIVELQHDIPILPGFEVALSNFEARGTKVRTRISHMGFLPEEIVSMIVNLIEGHVKRMVEAWPVRVHGNIITVDIQQWLPVQGIEITDFEVNDGVTVGFDYIMSGSVELPADTAEIR
jgi:hypothetical protein